MPTRPGGGWGKDHGHSMPLPGMLGDFLWALTLLPCEAHSLVVPLHKQGHTGREVATQQLAHGRARSHPHQAARLSRGYSTLRWPVNPRGLALPLTVSSLAQPPIARPKPASHVAFAPQPVPGLGQPSGAAGQGPKCSNGPLNSGQHRAWKLLLSRTPVNQRVTQRGACAQGKAPDTVLSSLHHLLPHSCTAHPHQEGFPPRAQGTGALEVREQPGEKGSLLLHRQPLVRPRDAGKHPLQRVVTRKLCRWFHRRRNRGLPKCF